MCTVTFIPRQKGYAVGMNRDEKLTRATGLPPARKTIAGRTVLSPSEPEGGTWIGVNDSGVCLALINWYAVTRRVVGEARTRGDVINSTIAATISSGADLALEKLPLNRINPFRLIGIFPAATAVLEWRWDLKSFVRKKHPWESQQWISSGLDEPAAQRFRSRAFRQAQRQSSAGSLTWLRRLHCSHSPKSGPYSTCMHRTDAATVSYTEVAVSHHGAIMRYKLGTPCDSCVGFRPGVKATQIKPRRLFRTD
jgi:hypothetical protein